MSRAIGGVRPESLSGLSSTLSSTVHVRPSEDVSSSGQRSKVVRAPLKFKNTAITQTNAPPVSKHEQVLGSAHNSGVSERAARDMTAHIAVVSASASSSSSSRSSVLPNSARDHLVRKAALYEKLVTTGVSGEGEEGVFLVDFERKGWERQDQLALGIDVLKSHQQHPQDHLNKYDRLNAPGSTLPSSSSSSTHSSFTKVAAAAHSLESQRSDWEQSALAELRESGDQAKREMDRANVIAQAESSGGGRMMLRQQAYAMHEEALRETKEAREKWLQRKHAAEQPGAQPSVSGAVQSASLPSVSFSRSTSLPIPPAPVAAVPSSSSSVFIPESARLQAMQESSNARAAWLEKRKRKMAEESNHDSRAAATNPTAAADASANPEQEERKARLQQLRRESLEQ